MSSQKSETSVNNVRDSSASCALEQHLQVDHGQALQKHAATCVTDAAIGLDLDGDALLTNVRMKLRILCFGSRDQP